MSLESFIPNIKKKAKTYIYIYTSIMLVMHNLIKIYM